MVSCYTFEKVLEMHSARGCEVLVIDAEGADCAILRSMVSCFRTHRYPWPRVIRFETRGVASAEAGLRGCSGCEEEEDVIRKLQQEGYLLVGEGGMRRCFTGRPCGDPRPWRRGRTSTSSSRATCASGSFGLRSRPSPKRSVRAGPSGGAS